MAVRMRRWHIGLVAAFLVTLPSLGWAENLYLQFDGRSGICGSTPLDSIQSIQALPDETWRIHYRQAHVARELTVDVVNPYVQTPGGRVSLAPHETIERLRGTLTQLAQQSYQFRRVEFVNYEGYRISYPVSQIDRLESVFNGWVVHFGDGSTKQIRNFPASSYRRSIPVRPRVHEGYQSFILWDGHKEHIELVSPSQHLERTDPALGTRDLSPEEKATHTEPDPNLDLSPSPTITALRAGSATQSPKPKRNVPPPATSHRLAETPTPAATPGPAMTPLAGPLGKLTDLTLLAQQGKLDPVVGRDTEIERAIQVLNAREKNNPVLLGETGVGKSAVARGVAMAIAAGRVPPTLQGRRVIVLEIGDQVAGTKYRGAFERRIKRVMSEARKEGAILFIDELHTVVGAGRAEGGALDGANLIKQSLLDKELRAIGATTLDEYRRYIEKDPALARRFEKVPVEPPNDRVAVKILESYIPLWREHYRLSEGRELRIPRETLRRAVQWSRRYLTEQQLPDSAKSLIELSLSRAQIDDVSGKRRVEALTEHDLAAELHTQTGIHPAAPASRTRGGAGLRDHLEANIIAQRPAIERLVANDTKVRQRMHDPRRPLGVFLFAGPTGVGKTETLIQLAVHKFGSREAFFKQDMSELGERHDASRVGGASPGYVGYEEGSRLLEHVRRRPYTLVLFDELEKAHPDAYNFLLQILEDGGMRDNLGRWVDFRNTIIGMTTNRGAREGQDAVREPMGFPRGETEAERAQQSRQAIERSIREYFKPELLGRIDDVIVFDPLGRADLRKILDLKVADVKDRLRREHRAELYPTEAAMDELLTRGVDPQLGARPMRRAVEQHVAERLAAFLDGEQPVGRGRGKAGRERGIELDYQKADGFTIRRVALRGPSAGGRRAGAAR
jgi:ATP-dependent Clp protease ATP-binding subunit ClpC